MLSAVHSFYVQCVGKVGLAFEAAGLGGSVKICLTLIRAHASFAAARSWRPIIVIFATPSRAASILSNMYNVSYKSTAILKRSSLCSEMRFSPPFWLIVLCGDVMFPLISAPVHTIARVSFTDTHFATL